MSTTKIVRRTNRLALIGGWALIAAASAGAPGSEEGATGEAREGARDAAGPRGWITACLDPVRRLLAEAAKDEPYLRVVSRTIEGERAVGFDYAFDYARRIVRPDDAISGWEWEAGVRSRGKLASERGANDFDSLVTEIGISGSFFLPWDRAELEHSEALARELRALIERPPEDEAELARRKAESAELERFLEGLRHARFAAVEAHLKHEGSQRFDDNDFAAGVGVTFDSDTIRVPGLLAPSDLPNALLDLLRTEEERSRFHPGPRFHVGCEVVTGLRHTEREARTGDDRDTAVRATFQAAWRADFLRRLRLKVSWRSYLEIAPPSRIVRADREFSSYIELALGYRLVGEGGDRASGGRRRGRPPAGASFVLQYQDGRLPPNFEVGSTVGIGLEAEF